MEEAIAWEGDHDKEGTKVECNISLTNIHFRKHFLVQILSLHSLPTVTIHHAFKINVEFLKLALVGVVWSLISGGCGQALDIWWVWSGEGLLLDVLHTDWTLCV